VSTILIVISEYRDGLKSTFSGNEGSALNTNPPKSCGHLFSRTVATFGRRSVCICRAGELNGAVRKKPQGDGEPMSGHEKRSARNGGIMSSMKKFFLGAALAVGTLTMSAAPAQAARVGVYFGARAVAVPACPGPRYAWVGGYWNNGFWVPGYWNFVGVGGPVFRGGIVVGRGPGFYHGGFYRGGFYHGGFRR
jgi:hypothetical protein